jgi:hypothetical protein
VNDKRAPTRWQPYCSHFFLYCKRDGDIEESDLGIALITPGTDKVTIYFLQISFETVIVQSMENGTVPFFMAPSAFEIAVIATLGFSVSRQGDTDFPLFHFSPFRFWI